MPRQQNLVPLRYRLWCGQRRVGQLVGKCSGWCPIEPEKSKGRQTAAKWAEWWRGAPTSPSPWVDATMRVKAETPSTCGTCARSPHAAPTTACGLLRTILPRSIRTGVRSWRSPVPHRKAVVGLSSCVAPRTSIESYLQGVLFAQGLVSAGLMRRSIS